MTSVTPQLGAEAASPPAPSAKPAQALLATWPRSAQLALGSLILVTAGLIAWNAYGRSRWATRPTALAADRSEVFRIDLNRADRAQLLQLPGAGDNLVSRIEAYRREHGGFRTVEDLRQVSGVGPVLLERWRPLVHVSTADGDDDAESGEESGMPPPRVVRGARPDVVTKPTAVRAGGKQLLRPGESLDINRASVADLQRIPGVGEAIASRIVDTRTRKAFTTVDDLKRVSGIGAKTLEKLRPYVRVE